MGTLEEVFQKAIKAMNSGKPLEAERLFKSVLKELPNNIAALNLVTIVLVSMERHAEAEAFISKAIKLNQSSDVSYYNYGLISKRLGKSEQALEQFNKAIHLNAQAPETWNNRGTVFNDLKQYENAITDFNQAISLAPNYSEAFCNKGKSLGFLKRYDQAFEAYDKALAIKPDLAEAWLGRGFVFTELKRYDEAFVAYDKALALKPDFAEAWLGRGNVFYELKRHVEAFAAYDKALAIKPDLDNAWLGRGNVFTQLKRYDEAFAAYDKALALKPDLAEAWLGRGNAFYELKRYDEALAAYEKALVLIPHLAELGRGNVFTELKRYDDAFVAYDKALALKPDLAEASLGRGNVFTELKRYDDAFIAYDKALVLKPDLAEASLGLGNVSCESRRYEEALAAYDKALALKPDLAGAWLGRGNVLCEVKRYAEAFTAYDKALALKPDLAEAWLGRGNAFCEVRRYDEALAAYDKALALKPDLAGAWLGRGTVFDKRKSHEEASVAYARVIEIEPQHPFAKGLILQQKMLACDWKGIDDLIAGINRDVASGKRSAEPFSYQAIAHSTSNFKRCAEIFAADKFPQSQTPLWRGERYNNAKIRVGYSSGEFRNHVTSKLMTELFELHDKNNFDLFAFDNGWDDGSELRGRINKAFNNIVDISRLDDLQAATLIKQKQIDILVNLNGYFGEHRTRVFSYRPSPIQVSYLGFSGTMGADYIDYIVGDRYIIPPENRTFYTESVAYLPDTYQVNDAKRPILVRTPTRAELELPDTGFIFCCFSNNFKITPEIFEVWMRLLNKVNGSVLWLFESNPAVSRNLRVEAKRRNIAPERLVFSSYTDEYSDYLARYQVADLFLDTLPFNAGGIASDALWAGLPLLTCSGQTYTARMAGSLLNAIGLPELITTTLEAYEQTAIDLAMQPEKLAAIKRKLANNRLTAPLFDTKLFTGHIEAAYNAMYERHQAGLAPDHIFVAN